MEGGLGPLDVISSTLLELDKSPSSSFGVINIFGNPGHTDGIGNKLYFVLHACSELVRFCVSVYMHLLRSARYDKDWNVSRFEDPRRHDLNIPNI